ncbi:MAG: FKBP-type peptidyl-prolyl cis-trans isomerase [Magnetococcales bacterium]|nr:FKBP-type peptidyl-prolyl cis-trans isomerase [Magnetococcales bacterium]
MKHLSLLAGSALALGCLSIPAAMAGDAAAPLKTNKERYSYAVGQQIGTQVQPLTDNLDSQTFIRGLKDVLEKKPPVMTPEQMTQARTEFRDVLQKDMEQKNMQSAEKNQKKGTAFLAENGKKPGVTTTASGLQYEVLTPGSGPKPKATDQVKVHYHGTLLDGTVFDSSIVRKEPVTFPLNRVIPGWTEGVQLMPVGGKYRFVIPSKLAYGPKGAPPKIEPESTLIFEVELLEIVGDKAPEKK